MGDGSYSVEDLERLLGLKGRTIHYWTQEGLFEGPGAGRGARYTDEHLAKLFLILKLREEGRSLAEIKTALKRLPTRALKSWVDLAKAEPPKETATAKELITRWLNDSHEPDVRAAWRPGNPRHSSQPSLWSGLEPPCGQATGSGCRSRRTSNCTCSTRSRPRPGHSSISCSRYTSD